MIDYRRDHDADRPLAPNLHFASALEPAPIPWLWPLRIPLGHLSLLVGDPGVGKSLLAADLAARVSVGVPWPDARPIPSVARASVPAVVARASVPAVALAAWEYPAPDEGRPAPPDDELAGPFKYNLGSVILVSHEDSRCAGILPRLLAAGANLDRVAILDGLYHPAPRPVGAAPTRRDPDDAPDRPLLLPEHLPLLQQAIRSVDVPRLVILDTLHSLLGPGASTSPDTISTLLTGLAETAAMYNVAILAIHHLTKTAAPRTLYRVRGSIPFVAAARAAFLLSTDLASPNRRFLSTLKSIYAPDAPPLAFEIIPRDLDPTPYFERPVDGRPPTPHDIELRRRFENPFRRPVPAIRWSDPHAPLTLAAIASAPALSAADAAPLPEELLADCPASRSALLEARLWLADYLAAGPKPAAPLIRDARADGHSFRTLHRAKRMLGVISRKFADQEPWVWYRPSSEANFAEASDNQHCQPSTRETGSLATFGQNAENRVFIGPLEAGNDVHDSARE